MPRALLLLAAGLALGLAPAPFMKPRRPDLDRLQGVWVGEMGALEAHIEGGRLTYRRNGKLVRAYALTLDPASDPKRYGLKGIVKGEASGLHYRGLYRLDGDTLTLCSGPWGEPRPAGFAVTSAGGELKVLTRKR